jgi:AcrR family transcriptional regulator
MSQRSSEIGTSSTEAAGDPASSGEAVPTSRPAPANAIGEERILDAAYELLLAIGMRRMTMADIARHAEVSRATLYRRWPNVQAVVAALMTREWTTALVSAFQPDSVDGRSRLVEGVVEVVAKTRTHPLMRKIIELDPEFLTPYLLERRGSSTVAHLALVRAGIEAGQADGSIRAGDPDWLSRQIILVSLASAVSGPVLASADEYPQLDDELRVMLTRYLAP